LRNVDEGKPRSVAVPRTYLAPLGSPRIQVKPAAMSDKMTFLRPLCYRSFFRTGQFFLTHSSSRVSASRKGALWLVSTEKYAPPTLVSR